VSIIVCHLDCVQTSCFLQTFKIVKLSCILDNLQSLFVLTLAKEKITLSMKILKVKIRVLAAWNNHRG